MTDLFRLILGILASRFKARATLEAENLVRGNSSMCFVGERRSDRTSTIRIVFYLFGSIAGIDFLEGVKVCDRPSFPRRP
jgi:hypothetical protein